MLNMYQHTISYEDFQTICRFCLSKGSTENILSSLFDNKNVSLTKTLSSMVDSCLGLQIAKDDDLPPLICSFCLKKLINSNSFRKQSISTDYQLKLLLSDFKEQRLLKEIEDRIGAEDPEPSSAEIELIEYIDDAFELEEVSLVEDANNDGTAASSVSEDDLVQDLNADTYSNDDDDFVVSSETEDLNEMQEQEYEEEQNECDDELAESSTGLESADTQQNKSRTKSDKKTQGRKRCEICKKYVVNLKPHMDTHIDFEQRRKPYQCTYCGKEYLQRAQFDGHVNREHTGLKPFKCDQCDKTFHGRPSLRMHKIQHSNVRRFNCEYCPKSYLYAHHLSHHRYTHTKQRVFTCDYCDYTNVHMENLKRHVLSKHTEDEDKPYQCETCFRSFNGKSNLQRHLKYVHHMERTS